MILKKKNLVKPSDINRFMQKLGIIMGLVEKSKSLETLLKDVPEKYQDPLTFDLMRDPVKLPDGSIVDRLTISRHLMNDRTNPFTRQPMEESDIQDLPEMKNEIKKWITDRIAEGSKKEDGAMDMSIIEKEKVPTAWPLV
eukprot:TRINITY_DN1551_c0_g1_i1.p1 TRINITY_DN1551_c0_g1~~TRINITY_DN1551_c0_g1_i1.p1  ORF type:complete len:140 (+),score=37.72 TRINITY_DN1551_c0_g1_i1:404-823(+)